MFHSSSERVNGFVKNKKSCSDKVKRVRSVDIVKFLSD